MADRITANLPSRDFAATEAFSHCLGLRTGFCKDGWMILNRGPLEPEFFPHPGPDRWSGWFPACARVDAVGALQDEDGSHLRVLDNKDG